MNLPVNVRGQNPYFTAFGKPVSPLYSQAFTRRSPTTSSPTSSRGRYRASRGSSRRGGSMTAALAGRSSARPRRLAGSVPIGGSVPIRARTIICQATALPSIDVACDDGSVASTRSASARARSSRLIATSNSCRRARTTLRSAGDV
jgi:hypothetical protein